MKDWNVSAVTDMDYAFHNRGILRRGRVEMGHEFGDVDARDVQRRARFYRRVEERPDVGTRPTWKTWDRCLAKPRTSTGKV